MRRMGVTLHELVVTVLVISVIVALASHAYVKSAERVKGDEALAVLRLLRSAEQIYYFDWQQRYTTHTVAFGGNLVSEGYVQNPNTNPQRFFDYKVSTSISPPTFTAQATRRNGCNSGETIKVYTDGTVDTSGGSGWTPSCVP